MGTTGEIGKELSWRVKTDDSSSKGDNKERFDSKPKVGDGGYRPFAMKRRRCGWQPPAPCPPTADAD